MTIQAVSEKIAQKIRARKIDLAQWSATKTKLSEFVYQQGNLNLLRTVFSHRVAVKLVIDQKKGEASINSFEDSSIDKIIEDALISSQNSNVDACEGISEEKQSKSFDTGLKDVDLDQLYTLIRNFFAELDQNYPSLVFDMLSLNYVYSEAIIENTNKLKLEEKGGIFQISGLLMAQENQQTSSFNVLELSFTDLEKPLISYEAIKLVLDDTMKQVHTQSYNEQGKASLLISPLCLADFLDSIQDVYLGDLAIMEKTSPWLDKKGEVLASPLFTWSIESSRPDLASTSQVSGDAYLKEDMFVFKEGKLKNFCIGRYAAKQTGRERSKNKSSNYIVAPGKDKVSDLIKQVKQGIVIHRFSGDSPSANGDMAGIAKNSFQIKDGEIKAAISETMVSLNLAEMLKNIVGISKERINNGHSILPWVLVENVQISGN